VPRLERPDEQLPCSSVLLASEEQLGKRARLRVRPVVTDNLDAIEVTQWEDVREFGLGGRREPLQMTADLALETDQALRHQVNATRRRGVGAGRSERTTPLAGFDLRRRQPAHWQDGVTAGTALRYRPRRDGVRSSRATPV
jgi:hypothetical protein